VDVRHEDQAQRGCLTSHREAPATHHGGAFSFGDQSAGIPSARRRSAASVSSCQPLAVANDVRETTEDDGIVNGSPNIPAKSSSSCAKEISAVMTCPYFEQVTQTFSISAVPAGAGSVATYQPSG
jgi:hypothetical protein